MSLSSSLTLVFTLAENRRLFHKAPQCYLTIKGKSVNAFAEKNARTVGDMGLAFDGKLEAAREKEAAEVSALERIVEAPDPLTGRPAHAASSCPSIIAS